MHEIGQEYKMTEIGAIPKAWNVIELGEISRYEGGSQPYLNYFSDRCHVGYIRLIQIRDYKTDKYAVYIPSALARKTCDENDIMIGRYGPPIFQILRGLKGAYNVALIKAIPNEKINRSFFYYTLTRNDLFQLIELLSRRSSGQTGVDLIGLKTFKIALPPIEEQTAIATALSDIDALISALDKKVAKKQQIKQGAMQQLLTGKKRLAGFSKNCSYKMTELGSIPADWEVKKIGELTNIITGNKNTQDKIEDGMYPFFVRSQIVERINSYSFDGEGVLTAGDGVGTGKVYHYINGKFDFHQRVYLIHNFDSRLNANYFYCFFSRYFYDRINQMTAKSSVDSVRREMISDMPIILPSINEQTAIAQVLTDMDNEINQLETERDKYKQIKAGMMQQLLTGKIRLTSNQ